MANDLTVTTALPQIQMSAIESGRVHLYFIHMGSTPWWKPNLSGYKDFLESRGYKPASIKAHLSSVRSWYRRVMPLEETTRFLYSLSPYHTPSDAKAFVDELRIFIHNQIDPHQVEVKETHVQDEDDFEAIWLTQAQAQELLVLPGKDTPVGIRDTAIISLFLCTGIRAAELCALEVDDLKQYQKNVLSLRIRHGKGDKQRLVPYGDLDWVLSLVQNWLEISGIQSGFVFRGFSKNYKSVRNGISRKAINDLLKKYPIYTNNQIVALKPHDLRRTYARLLHESGMDPVRIQQNLGHSRLETTLRYIGILDVESRRPKQIFFKP